MAKILCDCSLFIPDNHIVFRVCFVVIGKHGRLEEIRCHVFVLSIKGEFGGLLGLFLG